MGSLDGVSDWVMGIFEVVNILLKTGRNNLGNKLVRSDYPPACRDIDSALRLNDEGKPPNHPGCYLFRSSTVKLLVIKIFCATTLLKRFPFPSIQIRSPSSPAAHRSSCAMPAAH